MTNYHIEIESVPSSGTPGKKIASAFGDLEIVSYIGRKAVKELDGKTGTFSLTLNRVDGIGGNVVSEVVSLTAGAKVVTTVLKTELTSERKNGRAEAPATAEQNGASESGENGTQPSEHDKYGENVPAVDTAGNY